MAKVYIDYATNTNEALEKQDLIDTKIEILYDMAILKRRKTESDSREDAVRELLNQCETRYEMDTILHDVVRGNMLLNTLLAQGIEYLRGGI